MDEKVKHIEKKGGEHKDQPQFLIGVRSEMPYVKPLRIFLRINDTMKVKVLRSQDFLSRHLMRIMNLILNNY